jgi:Fic family protein
MDNKIKELLDELDKAEHHQSPWSDEERELLLDDFTFHSTKIEGLAMSYGDTMDFLKSGIIKKKFGIKDITDLVNHKAILNTIFNTYTSIRIDNNKIKVIHAELMKDPRQWETDDDISIRPGEFKEGVNYGYRGHGKFKEYMMSAFVAPNLEKATNLYYEQCKDKAMHPIEAIAQFHYTFLNEIHPFEDGNGRVARLIMAIQQLQNGLPVAYPKDENKVKYINAIIRCEENGNRKDLVDFLVDISIEAIKLKREKSQKLPFQKSK